MAANDIPLGLSYSMLAEDLADSLALPWLSTLNPKKVEKLI
jgi:hypothetical protein